MIEPKELSEKELKDQELITLHKNILQDYIKTNLRWDTWQRSKVMIKYDEKISRENIRHYYNRHIALFLIALLQDKLETIASYTEDLVRAKKPKKKKKKKKKGKNKKKKK